MDYINKKFTDMADWVSTAMGTPLNIMLWVLLVAAWFMLFAFHILGSDSSILPAWFTSNAFNFPLNTVTTLAELYIGFLIAAAANRVEKRNWELHQKMMDMISRIEQLEEKEDSELTQLLNK